MKSRCCCGLPLHYTNPQTEEAMTRLVQTKGEMLPVVTEDGTWLVPRHYIALHGLNGAEVQAKAALYGWKKQEVPS